ncbi:universal stress protein [Natrinema gelatinilyticum]|uniref:universal stress protein n=1 Tax=Natrinema gelatinilyticum TaxID=2961571 RepID=UPI0020C509A9|nr:universal stress protein [Natrinema gelatinilyticum]
MYERILIPTDGSENVVHAVENGIAIAEQFGATVYAFAVVPYVVTRDHIRYDPEAVAERGVEDIQEQCDKKGIDVITEVRKGEPFEEILAYSDENDIDVIVMGTHGRTGLDHVLIGSTAERVVRHAPIPVLTVRSKE